MKKIFFGVLLTAIALSAGTESVVVAGPGAGRNYVDADGDGVCDNTGAEKCGQNYVDADGDGVCDNSGTNEECGQNYVDADGDGVCDNYSGTKVRGCRRGNGFRRGCGR